VDNVGPERGLVVGGLINVEATTLDIPQNNTRNEGKYVGDVYSGHSEINI